MELGFTPATALITVILLGLAPFVAVMVTSFTKIVVVLSLLRNALGLQQSPPNVVLNGLALVLTMYVMYPVGQEMLAVAPPLDAEQSVLEASEIPGSGDLLLLGGQAPCELSPQKPAGAAGFAATLGVSEAGAPQGAPGAGGGVVAFEALLTPGQQAALRGGALLVVGPGPAPAATYAAGETVRTGAVVPMGDALAFRFD